MKSLDLSIVIVSYNARQFLAPCLSALQKTIHNISHEVIMVDNNSTDGSVHYVHTHFPATRVVQNQRNVGFAAANNQGIRVAKGTFILLLNPDTVVTATAVAKLVDYARNNPRVGILGCRVLNLSGQLQWDSCGHFLTPATLCFRLMGLEKIFPRSKIFGRRLLYYWPRNSSQQIDWVSGVCMLIRRQLIEEAGLLDEQFFAYYEDMDYCRRASTDNYITFFLHDAQIYHVLSTSWREGSEKQLMVSLRSEKRYLKKYYGSLGVFFFNTLYVYGSSIRLLAHALLMNKRAVKNHFNILKWIVKHEL